MHIDLHGEIRSHNSTACCVTGIHATCFLRQRRRCRRSDSDVGRWHAEEPSATPGSARIRGLQEKFGGAQQNRRRTGRLEKNRRRKLRAVASVDGHCHPHAPVALAKITGESLLFKGNDLKTSASGDRISIRIRRILRQSTARNMPLSAAGPNRNSRDRKR
jgi:hypothetical protein